MSWPHDYILAISIAPAFHADDWPSRWRALALCCLLRPLIGLTSGAWLPLRCRTGLKSIVLTPPESSDEANSCAMRAARFRFTVPESRDRHVRHFSSRRLQLLFVPPTMRYRFAAVIYAPIRSISTTGMSRRCWRLLPLNANYSRRAVRRCYAPHSYAVTRVTSCLRFFMIEAIAMLACLLLLRPRV